MDRCDPGLVENVTRLFLEIGHVGFGQQRCRFTDSPSQPFSNRAKTLIGKIRERTTYCESPLGVQSQLQWSRSGPREKVLYS
jgi:hypothetical protein